MYVCTDSRRHGSPDIVDLTIDTGDVVDLTSSCNNNNSVVRKSVQFGTAYILSMNTLKMASSHMVCNFIGV